MSRHAGVKLSMINISLLLYKIHSIWNRTTPQNEQWGSGRMSMTCGPLRLRLLKTLFENTRQKSRCDVLSIRIPVEPRRLRSGEHGEHGCYDVEPQPNTAGGLELSLKLITVFPWRCATHTRSSTHWEVQSSACPSVRQSWTSAGL